MTDHLPDCFIAKPWDALDNPQICICDALRACEARVMETRLAAHRQEWIADGYAAGVQAARDAVENAPCDAENWIAQAQRAADLAAIDALGNNSSNFGTIVPAAPEYLGQWHRDLYGSGDALRGDA